MSDEEELPLPFDAERALEEGMDPDDLINHIDRVGEVISELETETSAHNMCYAQSHVLERASELLREAYNDSRDYGDREAEMMAVAIVLSQEAEQTL